MCISSRELNSFHLGEKGERKKDAAFLNWARKGKKEKPLINGEVVFLSCGDDLRRHRTGGNESVPDSRGRRGPPPGNGMGFHVQGVHRGVPGRGGVWVGLGDQPAHLSHQQVHQLRCAAEEHCSLLSPRRLLLQLPTRSSGQPLQPRLQRHYEVQELNFSFLFLQYVLLLLYKFICYSSTFVLVHFRIAIVRIHCLLLNLNTSIVIIWIWTFV